LEIIFSEYLAQLPRRGEEMVIVIDGKTVRGTITVGRSIWIASLGSLFTRGGDCLMQMEVEKDKENEIVVAPKLLHCLDLHDKVLIGDAMHTKASYRLRLLKLGGLRLDRQRQSG
jgi:hypothetical protein